MGKRVKIKVGMRGRGEDVSEGKGKG